MLLQKFYNILSKEQCEEISQAVLDAPDLRDENADPTYYRNSHGTSNIAPTLTHVKQIENLILPFIKKPFTFSHTYSRIYRNGSYLTIHTDRNGLDITLSLCVKKQFQKDWPLVVSHEPYLGKWDTGLEKTKFMATSTSIDLEEGDAGIIEGTTYPHWREPLECDINQIGIYVFYHWTYV